MCQDLWLGCWGAFGVEGVGREAKVDGAGVLLLGLREELGEAGVAPEQEGQNTRGHGIQSAEMADGLFAGGTPDD